LKYFSDFKNLLSLNVRETVSTTVAGGGGGGVATFGTGC
jgi:hypothetical protein